MSHHTEVKVEISDPDVLVQAIIESFPFPITKDQIEVHSEQQDLINYYGKSTHKANIIIRRANRFGEMAANHLFDDVGWTIGADGQQIISDYDKQYRSLGDSFAKKLKQRYAVGKAKKEARRQGYRVKEKSIEGKVKLICEKSW